MMSCWGCVTTSSSTSSITKYFSIHSRFSFSKYGCRLGSNSKMLIASMMFNLLFPEFIIHNVNSHDGDCSSETHIQIQPLIQNQPAKRNCNDGIDVRINSCASRWQMLDRIHISAVTKY